MPIRVVTTFTCEAEEVGRIRDLLEKQGVEQLHIETLPLLFNPSPNPQPLYSFPSEGEQADKRKWYEAEGFQQKVAGTLAYRYRPIQLLFIDVDSLTVPSIGPRITEAIKAWQQARWGILKEKT